MRINSGTRRIGVMGGSFNPPHFGHFLIAQQAMDQLRLDKVLFIPTGRIEYKSAAERAGGDDRYNMLKVVTDSNPDFELSDIEISGSDTTYTANTLRRLRSGEYSDSELYFLVGADSLDYMERWYKPEVIFSLCTVAAAVRPGFSESRLRRKSEELRQSFGARIVRIDIPLVDISSTDIRGSVRAGKSIRYMTDDRIIEYIRQHGLYGGDSYGRN